jgi:DNA-directed RNA polymerase subunit RPC12/RpoP
MITRRCLDCDAIVTFPQQGDATCPGCGSRMYINEAGQIGRYGAGDWTPGGYGRQKA